MGVEGGLQALLDVQRDGNKEIQDAVGVALQNLALNSENKQILFDTAPSQMAELLPPQQSRVTVFVASTAGLGIFSAHRLSRRLRHWKRGELGRALTAQCETVFQYQAGSRREAQSTDGQAAQLFL